nr:hypothetical protein [Azospirillum brasilense]
MLYDRVEQTTITTGTGTLSLVAPSDASRRSFVQAAGSGTQVFYCIETIDGTQYEYGIGTCTAGSPDTLTRTTVLLSSNSNALVNFPSGTKRVFSTLPASRSGVTSRSLSPNGYQMLPGGRAPAMGYRERWTRRPKHHVPGGLPRGVLVGDRRHRERGVIRRVHLGGQQSGHQDGLCRLCQWRRGDL